MSISGVPVSSDLLREIATDPSAWPIALNAINSFLDASGLALLSIDERLKKTPVSTDMADMMADYFENGWHARDLRESCVPLLRRNRIVIDHEFIDPKQLETTAYYADFLRRHRRKWFAGVGAVVDDDVWCLAIQRSPDKGPFGANDMARLGVIRNLLADAVVLLRNGSRIWLDGAVCALESADAAALILDKRGKVIHLNKAASSAIGRHIDRQGFIQFRETLASQTLAEAIQKGRNWRSGSDSDSSLPSVMIGSTTYLLEMTPLLGKAALMFSQAASLLRLYPVRNDPAAILKGDYHLTAAEVRVAMALSQGNSVENIAELFKVSTGTVRMQLKGAYAKTQAASQAKLVAFINKISETPRLNL